MELATLALFVALLVGSVAMGVEVAWALVAGLALFCGYALLRGHAPREVAAMCWHGVRPIRRVLAMLLAVGALTGLWRAAGVIGAIIAYAVPLITPQLFLLMTFLLGCLVSFLTGTSFGTAATMGSICLSIASTMGVPLPAAGGAALSGAFFGDRWSPISTSALLVADVTGTDLYGNLRRMARSAVVPFLITCASYLALGAALPASGTAGGTAGALFSAFDLNPVVLLPPAIVLALAAARADILLVLATGILSAAPLCVALQGMAPLEVLRVAALGYQPAAPGLASLGGGGVASMLSAFGIVVVTSAYAGIFEGTELADGLGRIVSALSRRLASFATTLVVSVAVSMASCNQTLAIMLAHQLTEHVTPDPADHALDLEDSVVLVAGLVPWSIAGGVPLASMGAPSSSMALAVFLYAVPLWRLARSRAPRPAPRC